jgi:hypothetical protein
MMQYMTNSLYKAIFPLSGVKSGFLYLPFDFLTWYNKHTMQRHQSPMERRNPLISADPAQHQQAEILAALERAGWEIDADEPHVIEASDRERYGVAVFFERGVPVEICYGDGEEDLQFCEEWHEAPGVLAPQEVARLLGDEKGEKE